MPSIASTSGRLHSEFVRLLFLQTHRETEHFFAVSGVQITHSNSGVFHYLRVVFSSHLKSNIDNILDSSRWCLLQNMYVNDDSMESLCRFIKDTKPHRSLELSPQIESHCAG
jgi:hypothetical protein